METTQKSNEVLVIAFSYRTLIPVIFSVGLVCISAIFWWFGYEGASKHPLFSPQQIVLFFIVAGITLGLFYLAYLALSGQQVRKITLNAATQTLIVDSSNVFKATQKKYLFSAIKKLEWQRLKTGNTLYLNLEDEKLDLLSLKRETIADRQKINEAVAAFNDFLKAYKDSKRN